MRSYPNSIAQIATAALVIGLAFGPDWSAGAARVEHHNMQENPMKLGAFSVSLAVEDIHASKAFYEKLGFTEMGGNIEQNWLILRNDSTVIGLFQGMFEQNILTFNPGWSQGAEPLDSFQDVRELQQVLKEAGVEFNQEADESTDGPASFVITDPDGNAILVDQHVAKPGA